MTYKNTDNIWFTSDTHFFHDNILEYCKRPFKSTEHMNREMVRRWNSVVEEGEIVFHLGDFGYWIMKDFTPIYNIMKQLNGHIILISGNHDRRSDGIKSPLVNVDISLNGWLIHMSHEPNPIYKMNFSGHVHEKYDIITVGNQTIVNVGVDVWNFYPTNLEKINIRLDEKGMRKIE